MEGGGKSNLFIPAPASSLWFSFACRYANEAAAPSQEDLHWHGFTRSFQRGSLEMWFRSLGGNKLVRHGFRQSNILSLLDGAIICTGPAEGGPHTSYPPETLSDAWGDSVVVCEAAVTGRSVLWVLVTQTGTSRDPEDGFTAALLTTRNIQTAYAWWPAMHRHRLSYLIQSW